MARKTYKMEIYDFFETASFVLKLIRRDISAGKIILSTNIIEEIDEKEKSL